MATVFIGIFVKINSYICVIRWQPWQLWHPLGISYVSGLDPFWQPLGNHGNQNVATSPFCTIPTAIYHSIFQGL